MSFVDYIKLGKLKESLLLVFAGAAGGAVVNGIYTKYFQIYIYSLIMLFIAVMGTNSITNYIDKDIDSIMERTRKRPLPSGRINPPEKAIYYGTILILISIIGFLLIKRYYSIFNQKKNCLQYFNRKFCWRRSSNGNLLLSFK